MFWGLNSTLIYKPDPNVIPFDYPDITMQVLGVTIAVAILLLMIWVGFSALKRRIK